MNITQFIKRFSTDEACMDFIETSMWNEILHCPWCEVKTGITLDKQRSIKNPKWIRLQCSRCRQKYSAATNTFFYRTKIPLPKWLFIAYIVHLRLDFISEPTSIATLTELCCVDSIKRFLIKMKTTLAMDSGYLDRLFKNLSTTRTVAQVINGKVFMETPSEPKVTLETIKKECTMNVPEDNKANGDLQLCDGSHNKSTPVLSTSRNLYIKKISWEDICAFEELLVKIKSAYTEG